MNKQWTFRNKHGRFRIIEEPLKGDAPDYSILREAQRGDCVVWLRYCYFYTPQEALLYVLPSD